MGLKTLKVSNNNLGGSIPASIGNLPLLEVVELDSNKFNGYFPFRKLQNAPIHTIIVDDNSLEGEIPDSLDYKYLQILSLTKNLFFGKLPNFTSFESLHVLNLNHNGFDGTLPNPNFLVNLEELRVEENLLQGDLMEFCILDLQVFTSDCLEKNITCNCCTSC